MIRIAAFNVENLVRPIPRVSFQPGLREGRTPSGAVIQILVNHFKGGGTKRKRQAKAVRQIVNELVQGGTHVVVVGDLNGGPAVAGSHAPNLAALSRMTAR